MRLPTRPATWWLILTSAAAAVGFANALSISTVTLITSTLALWASLIQREVLARSLAGLTLVLLLPGFLSYITPEGWISTAQWQAWASGVLSDSRLETWRAPLLVTLTLALLALSLLLRQLARLGAPVLLAAALLLLCTQLIDRIIGHDPPTLLHYNASGGALFTLTLMIATHIAFVWSHWRDKRYIGSALWPAITLMLLALLLWQQQHRYMESALYQRTHAEGKELISRLTSDIQAHRQAMRRFSRFWQLLDEAPSAQQWARQAADYHADFRYFLNIAFIANDSQVTHVYPPTLLNRNIQGQRLFEAQPSGRQALAPALQGESKGSTGLVELLQGGPGIIYYWPIKTANQTPVGAAAMAVSIPMLADILFAPLTPEHAALRWHDNGNVLARFGTSTHPGPWQHHYTLTLGQEPLTLSRQPNRDYLLSQMQRLPSIGLSIALVLAYLLYLVLYTFKRLGEQHRAMRFSNHMLQREIKKRSQLQKEVEWLARHDELTGIANRRHFLERARDDTQALPLSLILCDIDHFKRINDQLGHLVGDDYLKATAKLGAALIEQHGGIFARYGGEEFVAWLPGVDHQHALAIAEQLRRQMMALSLAHADDTPLTLSAGVVTHTQGEVDMPRLMQAADEALYRTKTQGRNRVASAKTD
ncbi:sensor domain-containing diguanylate cyclase [Vreelandella salicampi]|uniref:diguanylate cyclase n=1 Tax=Vreelandella salicampi TaxID=1449798 RepID=A0A7Z0LJ18_9GAMM|nr:diguanylate cyclase [Halomonas salicampi]NYS59909.1 sensor domain-containing diguanylate cyclase [Halomonas salicampi]